MRILFITEFTQGGGAHKYWEILTHFALKNKFEIGFVLGQEQAKLPSIQEFVSKKNIPIYVLPTDIPVFHSIFERIQFFFFLMKICRNFKPDIIHVSNTIADLYIESLLLPYPIIYTLHTVPNGYLSKTSQSILKLSKLIPKTKYILTVSQYSAQKVSQFLRIKSNEVHFIYNGTEISTLPQFNKLQKQSKNTIVTVGTFHEWKNPFFWLEVAKSVIKQVPNIQFIWFGDGPLFEKINTKIHNYGLQNNIILKGYQKNVLPELAKANLYFHPSLLENNSIAVIEAMSLGLPCVVSDQGGLPETVSNTAIICDVNNKDEFKNAIVTLLQDKKLCKELGQKAYNRAKSLFSLESMEQNYQLLYKNISITSRYK